MARYIVHEIYFKIFLLQMIYPPDFASDTYQATYRRIPWLIKSARLTHRSDLRYIIAFTARGRQLALRRVAKRLKPQYPTALPFCPDTFSLPLLCTCVLCGHRY